MENKKKELKKLLPDFVKIEYIHGKLAPKEIKEKIKKFLNLLDIYKNRKLSTTIN